MAVAPGSLGTLELSRFFFAMVLLLFSSQSLGYVFHKSNMPKVVGEILGGLLLGPTLLGYFSPDTHDWIFNGFPEEGKLISLVSWLGLVLLMFISGFEIERSFNKEDARLVTGILLGATVVPLIAGFAVAGIYDLSQLSGPNGNTLSLTIIFAIAAAVTSIPVISRIFLDLGIMSTPFAKVVLAVATVEDIFLFAGLAIATGIAGAGRVSVLVIISTVSLTALFFALSLLAVPRFFKWVTASRAGFVVKSFPTRFALFVCLCFVSAASLLNINIVFGALLAGFAIGTMPQEIFRNARSHIRSISLAVFTPVYFAVVGLRLDLVRQFDPLLFLGFLLFSTALKTGGTLAVGRLVGKDLLSSLNLAVALNARGGPGIVLASVAFDLGIISQNFFVTLVMIAIVTSLFAGYWFKLVLSRGWQLLRT